MAAKVTHRKIEERNMDEVDYRICVIKNADGEDCGVPSEAGSAS